MNLEPQIITVDGRKEPFTFSGNVPTTQGIEAAIGGDVQAVPGKNAEWVLLVDEDSSRKDLPYNEAATDLVSSEYMQHNYSLRGTAIHLPKSLTDKL